MVNEPFTERLVIAILLFVTGAIFCGIDNLRTDTATIAIFLVAFLASFIILSFAVKKSHENKQGDSTEFMSAFLFVAFSTVTAYIVGHSDLWWLQVILIMFYIIGISFAIIEVCPGIV